MSKHLTTSIKTLAREHGFADCGITDPEPGPRGADFTRWLQAGQHAGMEYMARHAALRLDPALLEPWVCSIIVVALPYLPEPIGESQRALDDPARAFVSRYALGRDYHKLVRKRLKQLGERIDAIAPHTFRPFADSAPILEKALAAKTGIGWQGKNSLVLNRERGSYFFIGMLFTSLELPADEPARDHCGTCNLCIDACPTRAIVRPYVVDAGRCIAYYTNEHFGAIPVEFRAAIGNRIFGCDDCQIVCPWNKFAGHNVDADFRARHGLDTATLIELFNWDEATFLANTEGSAIRRLGHERWLRNVAVALGNALARAGGEKAPIQQALEARRAHPSALVREHVEWALLQADR